MYLKMTITCMHKRNDSNSGIVLLLNACMANEMAPVDPCCQFFKFRGKCPTSFEISTPAL